MKLARGVISRLPLILPHALAAAVAAIASLAPGAALAVDVTRFSGHITDVGIQRGPGQVGGVEFRIRGRIVIDQDLDLGASVVTLERLFVELGPGGAGELMTMMDDVPFLPYELLPKRGDHDKVLYDTPNFRPQIRLQIWRTDHGFIEFRLKLDRGLMRRRPQLCTPDPKLSTTDMTHTFTIDDGVNPPVHVSTVQPWECNPKDTNLRSRGRRSPSATTTPATPPAPTLEPGETPAPTPTPATTIVPGCLAGDAPQATLRVEPLSRNRDIADPVELDGSDSAGRSGGVIVRYRFESGDGRVQDGPDAKAVFIYQPGDYRPLLTVFDDRGCQATTSRGYSEQ